MFVAEFQKLHPVVTFWTLKRVVTKGKKKELSPFIEIQQDPVLGFWNCPAELFIGFPVSCIKPVIAGHLEVLFGDMLDEKGNEIHYRNRFFNVRIVFVFIVMESHILPIVGINAGGGNDGAPKVAADIFDNSISITEIGFDIDVEAVFIFFENGSLGLFEGRSDTLFQFIEEGNLKSLAQKGIVKVFYNPPEAVIRETALGKETMDVWIPFQRSAEGMKDTDKAGDEVSAFIHFVEKSENDTADSLKEAVKQGTVIQKERTQVFINGKNEVPVGAVNEFEGHFGRAVNAVFIAAGRTKFRMAAERDEFKFAAVGTAIHGAAKRGIPTIDHLLDVFHNNRTWMKGIFNFLIVFFKNLLKNIHKSIMQELGTESNPPLKIEGQGS